MESLSASLLRSIRLGLFVARRELAQRARQVELDARRLERLEELVRRLEAEAQKARERKHLAQR